MNRAERFRQKNGQKKQDALNSQAAAQKSSNAEKLAFQAAMAAQQLLTKFGSLEEASAKLDWRVSALVDLVLEKTGATKDEYNAFVRKNQIEAFDRASDVDDIEKGLVPANDATPEEGMHAIYSLRLLKENGEELQAQELTRSKVRLGDNDVLEEVDFVLLNMKVGETVSLNFQMQGRDMFAEVTLLGLRKQLPKAPPQVDSASPENSGQPA